MKKEVFIFGGIIIILLLIGVTWYQSAFAPTISAIPLTTINSTSSAEIMVIAENLAVPWDVTKLPDGTLLVTERPGNLVFITNDGTITRTRVPEVSAVGEGGLMGLALHPNFSTNRWLYLYRTVTRENQRQNEIVRYVLTPEQTLQDETIILSAIPGARFHDGGALSFGPDGYLYVTTGDALEPPLAQDRDSLAGKILRLTDTGEAAPGNPFNDHIYSYGHRNAQGLAFDTAGQLWSTEHGRSGAQSGFDEVNVITSGNNYGWPDSEGDTALSGTVPPALHSGPTETWAPASLAYSDGALYFAGLRGQRLYRASVREGGTIVALTAFFPEEYGRLRATRIFDDTLYLTTSNTDGRGQSDTGDDRLIAIPLSLLTPSE